MYMIYNVVHIGQHFLLLRNLFEPKSQDTSTLPKWQSGHSTNLGSQIPIISNTKLVLRNTILSHNGKLVKPTSGMILEFLKRQFVPLGSAIVKCFAFCFLKSYLLTFKFAILIIKVTNIYLRTSNQTNWRTTVYFKGYVYNAYL